MRCSAALVRLFVAGSPLSLAACGTSMVADINRPPAQPAPAVENQPEGNHASAPAASGTDHFAAPLGQSIQPTAIGGEPVPMFAEHARNDRSLVPDSAPRRLDRFAETGPVSTDGLTQVSFAQEGEDFDPVLTPDGKQIIFASTQHRSTSDIFVKAVNGSVITQLTNDPADDSMPAISPDSKRVAFASNRAGPWNIYVMPISGGKPVQVTASAAHDLHPSWSPDGSKLVFCRLGEISRRWELWMVEVTNPSSGSFLGYGMLPEWCPKPATGAQGGDRILFQLPRERGARTFGVWALDFKDGATSNPMAIVTSNDSALINPTWSPDGRFIVYAEVPAPTGRVEINQSRPSQSDLWMVASDGSAKVRLTDGNAVALMPHWGTGNRLVFFSDRGGRGNIWTIDTQSAVLACGGFGPDATATASAKAPSAPQGAAPAEPTAAAHSEHVATAEEPKH